MPTHAKHRNALPTRRIVAAAAAAISRRRGPLIGIVAVATVAAVGVGTALSAPASADEYVKSGTLARADFAGSAIDTTWPSAQVGGAWKLGAGPTFGVSSSAGRVALRAPGTSATASLPAAQGRDVESSATFALPALPAAGGAYAGLQVRKSGSTYYLAQVRVDARGSAGLSIVRVTGSTSSQRTLKQTSTAVRGVRAGERVAVQVRATGTDPVVVQARAWTAGQPRPSWQVSAVDADASRIRAEGALALWSYSSLVSRTAAFSWDDLDASALTRTSGAPTTGSPTAGTGTPSSAPTAPVPTTSPTGGPTRSPSPTPTPGGDVEAPTDPSIDTTGVRNDVGSARLGTTAYPVPPGALFVAAGAAGGGDGTKADPFSSIQAAVDAASSGATIVLRGGDYHQTVLVPKGKALTIQSYPHESVALDGSSPVSGFARDGARWTVGGWTTQFDASPTYGRGKPDGVGAFAFVDPAYPMASHPDQVWVDGVPQAQVGSADQLAPGRFFVDYSAQKLMLGSDPTGHAVRASTLGRALTILGDGTTVRGIAVRKFAPSVPDMGSIMGVASKLTFENVSVTDSATQGLSVTGGDANLTRVTTARNGLLGIHANNSDRLRINGTLSSDNNTEHFKRAPVSGGIKITRSRDIRVSRSAVLRNQGNGLWFDESVYDADITGNDVIGNTGHGVIQELSSKFTIADNVIVDSGLSGVLVGDSNQTRIWNNTISGAARPINIVQGDRRASNLSETGHDTRRPLPDPTVTWILGDVTVRNNVLGDATGNCVLCVEDYSHQQSADQARVTADSNLYQRPSTSAPTWMFVWSRGPGDPAVYTSLSAFSAATGQERNGRSVDGQGVLDQLGRVLGPIRLSADPVAAVLPADIAALIGQPVGSRRVGAF